ncbi:hypothetical protein SDJN02_19878, partial [Cucurbita argyrosperma subsp. argyrosperma]
MSCTKWDAARRAMKFLRHWKIHTHRRYRHSFPVDFRHVWRFIKRLIHPTPTPLRPYSAERQFSFNDNPIVHLKLHRRPPPSPPCDYEAEEEEEEEGIDSKAEKFIKMFYEEMRLQSQVSYLPLDWFSDADESPSDQYFVLS